MPPRSRNSNAALRVVAALWVLAAVSPCLGAPTGDPGAVAITTEDSGLYRAPPPGEDGAYLPEADEQQGADEEGAYTPEKYETDEATGDGTYDPKKYETVEGFDDGLYHPQDGLEDHDDGSYNSEIAEKTVGDDGSYLAHTEERAIEEDGSYLPEQYEKAEGDDGLYSPQLYEQVVGDDGAYHPDVAETAVGDDGLYHPDRNVRDGNHEEGYNPEIYEKVVGDDGSYHGTEDDDGLYNSNIGDLHQEEDGLHHPEFHESSNAKESGQKHGTTVNTAVQVQSEDYNGVADAGRQTPSIRVRRQHSEDCFQDGAVSRSRMDPEVNGGVLVKLVTSAGSVRETYGGVYRLQTLEEKTQQDDDGAYHPEKHETPAPDGGHDWTEGSVTADGDSVTPSEDTSEASDDGSYRAEHHKAEDYDERSDNGQNSVTSPVELTEPSDDGSYRLQQHTGTPTEDYDERADNGTDWRDNVVEPHDEGTEAADDGSYRPQEHGPRAHRWTSEDKEEVQLSPVVFQVGPKPGSDVSGKASGRVGADSPQPADRALPVPAV